MTIIDLLPFPAGGGAPRRGPGPGISRALNFDGVALDLPARTGSRDGPRR